MTKEWSIPFLNMLVSVETHASLRLKAYRKPTYTDQYLPFNTAHPLNISSVWCGHCTTGWRWWLPKMTSLDDAIGRGFRDCLESEGGPGCEFQGEEVAGEGHHTWCQIRDLRGSLTECQYRHPLPPSSEPLPIVSASERHGTKGKRTKSLCPSIYISTCSQIKQCLTVWERQGVRLDWTFSRSWRESMFGITLAFLTLSGQRKWGTQTLIPPPPPPPRVIGP